VRANNGTCEAVSTIKPDTVTTSRTVYLNLSGIWLEALRGVFGRDTALNSETTNGNTVLCKAKLFKRGSSSDLNLSGDNINTSNLFGDGVFDLTAD